MLLFSQYNLACPVRELDRYLSFSVNSYDSYPFPGTSVWFAGIELHSLYFSISHNLSSFFKFFLLFIIKSVLQILRILAGPKFSIK